MNIPDKDMDKIMVVTRVMGLAQEVSELDPDSILELVNEGCDDAMSILGDLFKDGIVPQMRASLAIMAFASRELKKTVPNQELLKKSNEKRIALLPEEAKKEIEELTIKFLKGELE